MKTLKTIGFAVLIASALVACNSSEPVENTQVEEGITGTFNADLSASSIKWKGQAVGGLKKHNGSISLSEGSITLENSAITAGSFTVDMKSITPFDENYGETEYTKADLVGHLSTDQFFLVDSFPTASFTITGADSTGVMGDLTIRGITNAEKIINVTVDTTANGITLNGALTFDRTKYNVSFESGTEEWALSNDIELKFEVFAQP